MLISLNTYNHSHIQRSSKDSLIGIMIICTAKTIINLSTHSPVPRLKVTACYTAEHSSLCDAEPLYSQGYKLTHDG